MECHRNVLYTFSIVHLITCAAPFYLPKPLASLQGRLALAGYTGAPRTPGDPRDGPWGFGLHTVNCSFHPYGELSLADVEGIFQEKFGQWDRLDGFMDYSLGLWSHDLGPLAQELREQGEHHIILSWQVDNLTICLILIFIFLTGRRH